MDLRLLQGSGAVADDASVPEMTSEELDALIAVEAPKRHLPPAFVKAIVAQESSFDPGAIRHEPQINDFSAGLMQVLLGTARSMGYQGTSGQPSDLSGIFDPRTNLEYGCRWLSHCLVVAGSLEGAASMYNGGWRPLLGFGRPVLRDITVCLIHDQHTGDCIKQRLVPAGEYANQDYVNSVMAFKATYEKAAA